MRRLKEKLGTRALASAEIDYHDAYAIPLGDNFNFMLEKVIHHSRIALAIAVLGITSRAFQLSSHLVIQQSCFGQKERAIAESGDGNGLCMCLGQPVY